MKVITEERLRELIKSHERMISDVARIKYRLLEDLLDYECKEIDTLTVSRLRPFVDLDIGKEVLIYCKDESGVYFHGDLRLMEDGFLYDDEGIKHDIKLINAIGWLPVPAYKPEKE